MNEDLINKNNLRTKYDNRKELFNNHIFEQYKLYVEMADKVSSRRHTTNVFFLTLNTSIIGFIGFAYEKISINVTSYMLFFLFTLFFMVCLIWWILLWYYRNINSVKFKVIGMLEKELPSNPFSSIEWQELYQKKKVFRFLSLSILEQIIPIIFMIIYLIIGCISIDLDFIWLD